MEFLYIALFLSYKDFWKEGHVLYMFLPFEMPVVLHMISVLQTFAEMRSNAFS